MRATFPGLTLPQLLYAFEVAKDDTLIALRSVIWRLNPEDFESVTPAKRAAPGGKDTAPATGSEERMDSEPKIERIPDAKRLQIKSWTFQNVRLDV